MGIHRQGNSAKRSHPSALRLFSILCGSHGMVIAGSQRSSTPLCGLHGRCDDYVDIEMSGRRGVHRPGCRSRGGGGRRWGSGSSDKNVESNRPAASPFQQFSVGLDSCHSRHAHERPEPRDRNPDRTSLGSDREKSNVGCEGERREASTTCQTNQKKDNRHCV
jgi:hypothetical protein